MLDAITLSIITLELLFSSLWIYSIRSDIPAILDIFRLAIISEKE